MEVIFFEKGIYIKFAAVETVILDVAAHEVDSRTVLGVNQTLAPTCLILLALRGASVDDAGAFRVLGAGFPLIGTFLDGTVMGRVS